MVKTLHCQCRGHRFKSVMPGRRIRSHTPQSMPKRFKKKKKKKSIVNLGGMNRFHCKIISILLCVWIFYNKTVRGEKKISQAFQRIPVLNLQNKNWEKNMMSKSYFSLVLVYSFILQVPELHFPISHEIIPSLQGFWVLSKKETLRVFATAIFT